MGAGHLTRANGQSWSCRQSSRHGTRQRSAGSFLHGGEHPHPSFKHGDLMRLDLQTLRWTTEHTTGTGPGARSSHTLCALQNGRALLVLGGPDADNAVYLLDMATRRWSKMKTTVAQSRVPRAHERPQLDAGCSQQARVAPPASGAASNAPLARQQGIVMFGGCFARRACTERRRLWVASCQASMEMEVV